MRVTILFAIFASLSALAQVTRPLSVTLHCQDQRTRMILTSALQARVNLYFSADTQQPQATGPKPSKLLEALIQDPEIMDAINSAFAGPANTPGKTSDLIIAVNPESRNWVKSLLSKEVPILIFDLDTDDGKLVSFLGASLPDKSRSVSEVRPDQEHPITRGMKPWELTTPAVGLDPVGKSRELEAGGSIWAREIDDVRIVATTLGSDFPTLLDTRVLDILGQSILWLTDTLADHGGPKPGYGGNGETTTLAVMRELLAIAPKQATGDVGASTAALVDLGDTVSTDWKAQFDEPVTGRYLTFEILSTHSDGQFASVSELIVLGPEGKELSRDDWRVTSSSSEQAPKQLAKHILDGESATIWHSRYINGVARFPHTFRIDMRNSQTATGVICKPREGGKAGITKGYRVYLSEGAARGELATQGEFAK